MIPLLLFFVGFGLDAGRLYVSRTELQNAADSCALAGADALTGSSSNQLNVSEAWAIKAADLNRIGMQAIAPTIAANSQVTYSATLNGAYATKSAIGAGTVRNMKYVKCRLQETNVQSFLWKIANTLTAGSVASSTLTAMAVASLTPSSSACAVPLAVCSKGAAPTFGLTVGNWVTGKFDPGNSFTGAYKWLNFPGYTSVPDMKNMLEGVGSCTVSGSTTVTSQNGSIASLLDPWNNHFGLYKGKLDSVPDYTGYSYDPTTWPAGNNAYADFVSKRSTNDPPPDIGNGWKSNGWATVAKGDRRLVVAPVVDCPSLGGGAATSILDWACMLMLNPVGNVDDVMYMEFTGFAGGAGSPCGVSGSPGGPSANGPRVPTLVQ